MNVHLFYTSGDIFKLTYVSTNKAPAPLFYNFIFIAGISAYSLFVFFKARLFPTSE